MRRVYLARPPYLGEYRRRATELAMATVRYPMRRDFRGRTEGYRPRSWKATRRRSAYEAVRTLVGSEGS